MPPKWRKANITHIFKRDKKEYPRNYRLIIVSLIPVKVMEQLILETIAMCMNSRRIITSSQYVFMKGKSCLAKLINFYDEMTSLVEEGRAVDIVCLKLSKAFDTFPHKILIEKMLAG